MFDLVGLLQRLQANVRLAGQRMMAGAVQALVFFEQRRVIERRLFAGKIADGQVQALLQQLTFKVCRHGADQFQAHRLVTLAKALDGPRQAQGHGAFLGFGNADAHLAEQTPGYTIGLMAKRLDLHQQLASGLEQHFTLGGQAKAALAAAAQAITQTGFQARHLLADAWLAQAQHALGGAEATGLDYSDEQPQQMQVEVVQLSQHQTLLPMNVRLIDLPF
ncbi:protein of unknown function [Pseudomonas sp. JV241A]|nr:protein of unknown function [Pseudomonas sp. JV241A]